MKKRRNPSENGVTLIALIVMIIILLILSVLVIRRITGNEGIIKTTGEVAITQEIQEYKERITEEVRAVVVKYAAIGEETGLEEIAEEIDEQTTWVKKTILNIGTKTTNDDILVEVVEGYVFQIFYDSMYNVVNVEYIGNEDGEAFPELLASFERTTSIINATASDSKNEIVSTEMIFRGETIEPNGNHTASSLTHKGIDSGWYIIKTTSSTGKLRYAWIRANTKANGLTPPEIEIVSAGLPGQEDWYGQDNQPVITRIYTTNPRTKRIHYEISGVSPAKTEEAPGMEVTLEGINTSGSTYIIAWTLDDKGGESDPTRYEVKYDNQKPEIIKIQETGETKETVEGEQEETRWYKSDVELLITEYLEEHSGVISYSYQKQGATSPTYVKDLSKGQTISAEGKTVIAFALQDKAGNESAPETVTIFKDTVPPIKFTPTVTEETIEGFKINVSTQDGGNPNEASGIAYYDIYVHKTQGDKKVKESLKNTTGEYIVTGLEAGTTYTVFAVAYDKAGNNITSQTANKTINKPPQFTENTTATAVANTNNQITITATAIDTDAEDTLTYTLWRGTSSDNLTSTGLTKTGTSGQQVSFLQTGSNYTQYYFRIDVSDGTVTVTGERDNARTYCKSSLCPGKTTISVTCSTCSGNGTYTSKQNCSSCSGKGYNSERTSCSTCHGSGKKYVAECSGCGKQYKELTGGTLGAKCYSCRSVC